MPPAQLFGADYTVWSLPRVVQLLASRQESMGMWTLTRQQKVPDHEH